MTIHPLQNQPTSPPGQSTPYDSVWVGSGVPVQEEQGLEKVMLAEDKLYVVLAVVLIIWIGLIFFVYRTDRKVTRLERKVDERIPEREGQL